MENPLAVTCKQIVNDSWRLFLAIDTQLLICCPGSC